MPNWTGGRFESPESARFSRPRRSDAGALRRGSHPHVQLQVAAEGVECAMLFSEIGPAYYAALGFEPIATIDRTIAVIESPRYGAPMTMVRAGERRDLQAIAAMGRRARRGLQISSGSRRGSDRIRDCQETPACRASARPVPANFSSSSPKRARPPPRTSSSAWPASAWTIEECGDRDASGARVGALLQVLIAREPAERRPTIVAGCPTASCRRRSP